MPAQLVPRCPWRDRSQAAPRRPILCQKLQFLSSSFTSSIRKGSPAPGAQDVFVFVRGSVEPGC